MVGEKYVEPAGKFWVKNLTTGDYADCNCIARSGWIVKEKDKYNCTAVITNKDGLETYTLSGKLTEGITATNSQTFQKTQLNKIPKFPENINKSKTYGFSMLTL